MFLRGIVYWIQDNETGKQHTLRTKNRAEAERLFSAKNEAHRQPVINLHIARAYLMVGDPLAAKRTWQAVMEEIVKLKKDETQRRWQVAIKDKAFAGIRNLPLLETRAQDFLRAMEQGKVSTNIYLRRIHNFALGMNWLPVPVIPKRMWPDFSFKEKRAITLDEHRAIVAREQNPERRDFYALCLHLGGSQSDIAHLDADQVDWKVNVVGYARKKTASLAFIHFGEEISAVLRRRPTTGPLFPYLRTVRSSDRATEFKQRCTGLGIKGVTLHSYRYAWAERARKCGYPERFAQEALGHNSKAVHRSYAKRAQVTLPSLENYERMAIADNVIPMNMQQGSVSPQQCHSDQNEADVADRTLAKTGLR